MAEYMVPFCKEANEIIRAVGLDPSFTRRAVITIEKDSAVIVNAELYGKVQSYEMQFSFVEKGVPFQDKQQGKDHVEPVLVEIDGSWRKLKYAHSEGIFGGTRHILTEQTNGPSRTP